MSVQKTEHAHISYDTERKKFRVVIDGNHVCYCLTLAEAIRRRNHELLRLKAL